MKYQATTIGEIVEGNDPPHPSPEQRKIILQRSLTSYGWEANIQQHELMGEFVKFTAKVHAPDKNYTLEVYIFPNLADSARKRPHEKRIQLTRPYNEHQEDFELKKDGDHRCLLLGCYMISPEDVVICAWDTANYHGHKKPNSCYIDIRSIAKAFQTGFAIWQDTKGHLVCCFRPELIYYYIENMARFHAVSGGVPVIDSVKEPKQGDVDGVEGAENVIYYGAPGTGKSHTVDQHVAGRQCVRTVFHPDMQNSDFVGALKPVMQDDRVTYSFSPGPFAEALKTALQNPTEEVHLVIEELNRAPAAAVFGDLFLLLDRHSDGSSKYDVDFPTPEFRAWLDDAVYQDLERISLPKNLWILATMNSADQGVYPIDTAFRRRWRQEYIPINYDVAPNGDVEIVKADGTLAKVRWRDFAQVVNNHLTSKLSIAEDRLLGPWFVTTEDLTGTDTIPGKVLIYLWDDLLRHHGREQLFYLEAVHSFGELSQRVANSERVLTDELLAALDNVLALEGG